MAMLIMNNTSAMMALGELNKNISSLGKQLKKVSTGMKIVGADDGASEYVISERMRVRINALEQDAANVQTGCGRGGHTIPIGYHENDQGQSNRCGQ